ncbi:MAG: DEAD/DEAH box helicase [Deltaproteobacteria bacterium]|nr:DEAD/DEAH box helicase [Deltaproteobacteria bacterium]
MSLLAAVRENCPPLLFERGASYARAGGVARNGPENFVVRVPGRADAVEVWLSGEDYECTCGADGTCGHVAAVAVALAEGHVAETARGTTYKLRRDTSGLIFDREVPDGAPRRAVDTELNRVLAGQWGRPNLPRGLAGQAIAALRGETVRLDGETVTCDGAPVTPIAIVVDEGDGWKVRLVRRPGIDEAFVNGVVRMGAVLRPLGETKLDLGQRQRLVNGVSFAPGEAARLVTEFLPDLRKLVDVELRTQRLPEPRRDAPRLLWDVTADGHRLRALAHVVYGDPAYARLEHGELRRLDARVIPARDRDAERRLLESGVPVGVPVENEGAQAALWVNGLPAPARQAILSRAPGFHIHKAAADPEVSLVGDGDYRVQLSGDVDPRALVEAWRDRAPLLPLLSGGWRPVPRQWLDEHAAVLAELLDAEDEGGGKITRAQAPLALQALEELGVEPPAALRGLRALAGDFDAIPPTPQPGGFRGVLRAYQQRGVDWIAWLRSVGMGGLLADDMGLGKTVQCLASLPTGRHLVVAPTSVLHNWAAEAERFRPDLQRLVYHGPGRKLDQADLVLTTWGTLRLDAELLAGVRWTTAIFDEAQAIKNPESQVAMAARKVAADLRLCVSGTPVENRLDELWSAMQVANPGLLGSRRSFRDRFATPIENGQRAARDGLRRRIRPFVLRRTKQQVAPELPPRTTLVMRCALTESERGLYDSVRTLSSADARRALAGGKGFLQVLEVLLRMRQAACHPGLLPGSEATSSSKLELLLETLDEVVAEGHRALVFSQWTSMLDLVEPALAARGWSHVRLDGSTRDRAAVVNAFNADEGPPVFLLSLKAGGTGLNLTAADYVFHLDPWWNPAVEDQATDRAHRIGQTRPVVSVRLVAEDTVEERILALQERKRDLVRAALDEDALARALSADELAALFE